MYRKVWDISGEFSSRFNIKKTTGYLFLNTILWMVFGSILAVICGLIYELKLLNIFLISAYIALIPGYTGGYVFLIKNKI